jgi:hypothetical protein
MKRLLAIAVVAAACGGDAPPTRQAAAPKPAVEYSTGSCPANGVWAECSVLYRLERAGVAPSIDSTSKPDENALGGSTMLLKIGLSAHLEVHLYADSAARAAATAKLDRTQFVGGTQEQTIKRERTLIESANLVAFLTSINSHQRERVSDALTAGPPQPTGGAQPLPPSKSSPPTTTTK